MKKRLFAALLALMLLFTTAASASFALFDSLGDAYNDSNSGEDLVVMTAAPTAAPTAKPASAPAAADSGELTTPYGPRIADNANLFTDAQEQMINDWIIQFQKETGMDFVVVTYQGNFRYGNAQEDADLLYEQGCAKGMFGNVEKDSEDEDSGMLLYINIDMGEYHVSTTGRMIDFITDERAAALDSELLSNLKNGRRTGDYSYCALELISSTQKYVHQGIPEGAFQYDVITGQMLTPRHKALTGNEIMVSALIGVVVMLIVVFSVNRSYKLKFNTYKYSYRENHRLSRTRSGDQYIRTSVSRIRRSTDSGSRPGGGGGFSGGSGVHMSSGGGSHGGFGGKF